MILFDNTLEKNQIPLRMCTIIEYIYEKGRIHLY